MKIFLTVRGNLILVNLIVISLILWLAISFLQIAVSQRSEAVLLQSSMLNERVISQISESLADERQAFSDYLGAAGTISELQRAALKTAIHNTDVELDAMSVQIAKLIAQSGFIERIPATRSSLDKQFQKLQQHRTQLTRQRNKALAQVPNASGKWYDRRVLEGLSDAESRIQDVLVNLAKSLKYLPDTDAASVAVYNALLDEILIARVELARKNAVLTPVFNGRDPAMSLSAIQIAVLGENIEQRLPDLTRLALASDKAGELYPIAIKVQKFYLQDYSWMKRAAGDANALMRPDGKTRENWSTVVLELNRLIARLADKAHEAIEILAVKSASRANRNLVVDAMLVILCFVITFASVVINRRVKRYAYHDSLTHLANRMNFESTLKEAKVSGAQSYAVIFLDLDRFKSINDNYGHAVGDELLIEVAARLKAICRPSDLLARLGGDEFAVFLVDVESEAAVEVLACSMVTAIERVITIRELNLKVGASAGVSIAPCDCSGGVELLRNADMAMYHTKSNNLSSVFRFNQEMAISYQQRLSLEQDLKKSLDNGELHLVYQPKVCMRSGKVKSVEALLRWSHPERGLISPVQFIPIAEEMGLMGKIGFWVLDEACREVALLRDSALPDLQVAVNISSQQFGDEHFSERVHAAIDKHGITSASLSLEVTESIVMNDMQRVIVMLKSLQNAGIDIAVDDFGTGYSSLQYLQELPLNTLKIDKAFIGALDDHDPTSSVANSIVQLATLFNLETVAEGVETLEQEMKVRSLGVDHIQGYLYSKPVAAGELPDVVVAIGKQFDTSFGDTYYKAA